MIYLQLFYEFFKIGLFAVGGGLATIPFLYNLADKYPWFDSTMLSNMVAVGESTPGPIGVNMATYAGITTAGIPGGLVATFALILPSYLIILLISHMLLRFRQSSYVNAAFTGLRPAVTGLIAAAGLGVLNTAVWSGELLTSLTAFITAFHWQEALIFAACMFITLKWKKLHPIAIIVASAALGILLSL